MMHWTILLAAEAAEGGGLFDLDATLPLMAIQFMILVAILNALFYKPIGKAIDDRDGFVSTNLAEAQERLMKANALADQYEEELSAARRKTQEIVGLAQQEASAIASGKIAEAQQAAQSKREAAQAELTQQKQEAMSALDQQVDSLSHQIVSKLLAT
ncbi:MAG: F0F1 ATP synthase subunit B' [Cyanobacteria bacterium J06633_2]